VLQHFQEEVPSETVEGLGNINFEQDAWGTLRMDHLAGQLNLSEVIVQTAALL
jgi:hypothetical protein